MADKTARIEPKIRRLERLPEHSYVTLCILARLFGIAGNGLTVGFSIVLGGCA